MIYDNISYLNTYFGISDDIRLGLEYLRDVNPDIEEGVYVLTPRVKAIVSEYTTKEVNENGYETHRQFIDIQYLISGEEKVLYAPLEYLKVSREYNKDKDIAFYNEACKSYHELLLGNGFFTILFPQDGHMPQLCTVMPTHVKKIVIKVML